MFSKKLLKRISALAAAVVMAGTMGGASVYADDSGQQSDLDKVIGTIVKVAELKGDGNVKPGSNSIEIKDCTKGSEYVISVVQGKYDSHEVTKSSVSYIDQKKAEGESVSFDLNLDSKARATVLLSSNDDKCLYPIVVGEINVPVSEAYITFVNKTYTGRTQYAALTKASYKDWSLENGKDMKFSGKGVNVGSYKVTVTGLGGYTGTTSRTFKINPVGTKLSSVKAGKKQMTVKWYKPSSKYKKQMKGYQLQYAKKSDFSGAKTVTAGSYTTKSKTIKGLTSKATYYVRIRTYKSSCYSAWSKAKAVKIK